MLENAVEKSLTRRVRELGGRAYKFVSPGRSGVPDRIVLLPIQNINHRLIVANYFRFVECKQPNKDLKPHQNREKKRIEKLGFRVDKLDQKL